MRILGQSLPLTALILILTSLSGCGDSGSASPGPTSTSGASTGTSSSTSATSANASGSSSTPAAALPTVDPGYILGNASASAMAASEVMGSCTPALMSASNTATQNVAAYMSAAQIALKATFGNVCIPPGILPFATVTLTQAFSGLHTIGTLPIQTFFNNQPSLGYSLSGGTVLHGSGSGSGPAFQFVGAGGPGTTWAAGFLTNVSFENLGFDSWDRQFLFGGTNVQGVSYSKFNNLYGTNIGVRAFDFINCVSVWIDNLYGYFSGSGFRIADDLDSATYGTTTNSYVGNLQFTLQSFAAEGIVLEATAVGAHGSQLNEIQGGYWFVERPGVTAKTQSVTTSAGSPVLVVSNNTYLPVGMPVGFMSTANGFTTGETYFVVSSSSNSIQVSKTYGGPAIDASGSSPIVIKSVGGENIALRALGVESLPNHGVISNVHIAMTDSENASGNAIFLQGVAGGDVILGEIPSDFISGVAMRAVTGFTITNGGSGNPTRDNDGYGGQDNYWYGSYSGPDVQSTGFLGQGKDVNGLYYRTALAPTADGIASPGLSVRGTSGSFLYSDFGIGQPYSVSSAASLTLNTAESGIFAYAGTGGSCLLPQISNNTVGTSLVGLPYWFTNVGSGPCTISTQAGQTFSGLAGVTTLTVQVGGTVGLSAEPAGSGFTWHVLSYVQPSQVRYGSLSLPTTTVASLPTCGPAQKGLLYSVSDAAPPSYNATVIGGGANTIPVFCNGSSWTAH
jgi:hypothetical protein